MIVTEICTCGLMNEQAFTWLNRRALYMHKLLHLPLRKDGKPQGYNDISQLLCQNDVRDEEKKTRSRVSYSKVWQRQERLKVIFNGMKSVSLWLYVNCQIFSTGKQRVGEVQYIGYIGYYRRKNYNKIIFLKKLLL